MNTVPKFLFLSVKRRRFDIFEKMKEGIKEGRSARIVEIAENVFFDKGYAKTTVSDICKAANCSRTTLYTYFDTKENIYLAVVKRSFRTFLKYFYKLDTSGSTGLERILKYVEGYIDFCKTSPKHYALIMDFYLILKGVGSKDLQSDTHLEIAKSRNFAEVEASAKLPAGLLIKEIEAGQEDLSITSEKSAAVLFVNIWAYLIGIASLSDFSNTHRGINILDVQMENNEVDALTVVKGMLS